uniref:Uncharacterized protein n=1 Tax=Arundo donax TaxID=35708 RepID=A0A0A8ZK10_ARUDO
MTIQLCCIFHKCIDVLIVPILIFMFIKRILYYNMKQCDMISLMQTDRMYLFSLPSIQFRTSY